MSVINDDQDQQEQNAASFSAIPEEYAYRDPMKPTSAPELRGDVAGEMVPLPQHHTHWTKWTVVLHKQ